MAHYAILQAHTDLWLHRNVTLGGKGLQRARFGLSIPPAPLLQEGFLFAVRIAARRSELNHP